MSDLKHFFLKKYLFLNNYWILLKIVFHIVSYIIALLFPFEVLRQSSFLLSLSDIPELTVKTYDLLFTFCPIVNIL